MPIDRKKIKLKTSSPPKKYAKRDDLDVTGVILSSLTDKQKNFAENYVVNRGFMSNKDIAIAAGSSPHSASERASEMLRNPKVKKAIEFLNAEMSPAFDTSKKEHIRRLRTLSNKAANNGAYAASINAEQLVGRSQNYYTSVNVNLSGSIEDMSIEEVRKELDALRERYGPKEKPVDVEYTVVAESKVTDES